MTTTGICKYCGQVKTIDRVPEGATEEERNRIATDECDCPGAKEEKKIEHIISRGKRAVDKCVAKDDPHIAELFNLAVEGIARGTFADISINSMQGVKYSMTWKKDCILVQARRVEITESDGETVDAI